MAGRGPAWSDWVDALPAVVRELTTRWELASDGQAMHGHCSLVIPVRTATGDPAALKIGFPESASEHEHLALRHWGGDGAVRLLAAEPRLRGLLLERLGPADLSTGSDTEACRIVGRLYARLHLPGLPQLRSLHESVARWTGDLAEFGRGATIPRRLVEQAIALGRDLSADTAVPHRVLHTDLHYGNVLQVPGDNDGWLAIDPKPLNGDPHYEIAPMLWNRWSQITGDVRGGVRRRLRALVDAAGFDEERARDWVVVRMVHNAMWALAETPVDREWLTVCIAVAKAVQ